MTSLPPEVTVSTEIIHDVGIVPAVVLALIEAQGDGTQITNQQIATLAKIPLITARRAKATLIDHGLLKAEEVFVDNAQRANRYQIPTRKRGAHSEQGGAHIEQANMYIRDSEIDMESVQVDPGTESSFSSDQLIDRVEVPKGTTDPVDQVEALRASLGTTDGQDHAAEGQHKGVDTMHPPGVDLVDGAGEDEGLRPSSGTGSPDPKPKKAKEWRQLPRKHLLYTHRDTEHLVTIFSDHIAERDVRERGKAVKVGSKRMWSRRQAANDLLDLHAIDELVEVVDHLFTFWHGMLPFPVINPHTGYLSESDRRITNLRQILAHWDQITEAIKTPEIVMAEKAKKPKDYYQRGVGFEREAEVTELVELWKMTGPWARREATDYDLFGWRKTFRILLAHREIPFDDIAKVITALANRSLMLEHDRYLHPFDLNRPREWDNIKSSVEIALMREEMRNSQPSAPARPVISYDPDEHG